MIFFFLSSYFPYGKIENFQQKQCSYSLQHYRCWCALEHIEKERRLNHVAFLCVTNFLGNATSPLINFTPLDICKRVCYYVTVSIKVRLF